jgi:hypothetical protein
LRKFSSERLNTNIQAGESRDNELKAVIDPRKQLRILTRNDLARVGIEGQHSRDQPPLGGLSLSLSKHCLVAEMNPVEVTDHD